MRHLKPVPLGTKVVFALLWRLRPPTRMPAIRSWSPISLTQAQTAAFGTTATRLAGIGGFNNPSNGWCSGPVSRHPEKLGMLLGAVRRISSFLCVTCVELLNAAITSYIEEVRRGTT
jgi:hypothetical protein